ncbi:hypothetical protein LOAG_06425 [Loa loa]|uniref:Uncharacterized protein n=1 Tax=Loa loa TaxID=7209 RepID=A0A1S0TXZ5_LOALO|nr:hypothetical protein LOAG_06425 [Loa loa]EFO22064.1 hypothetical protein LOAG_06425 [Loa loa]
MIDSSRGPLSSLPFSLKYVLSPVGLHIGCQVQYKIDMNGITKEKTSSQSSSLHHIAPIHVGVVGMYVGQHAQCLCGEPKPSCEAFIVRLVELVDRCWVMVTVMCYQ